jgi:hypothetical protein
MLHLSKFKDIDGETMQQTSISALVCLLQLLLYLTTACCCSCCSTSFCSCCCLLLCCPAAIEERIARWTLLPVENGEGLQVLRYNHKQKYDAVRGLPRAPAQPR